ncbi:mycothiol synthase [Georgenia sp. EYE_87]|uniref:mycothiol synthase n=1 Tax=Georgenia sp. EYE_87 TaxID=2853448 RepID=UPI002004D6D1|nr:mycothiol synthase [Georgenia sp. EYE_87]MCK6209713.1 mycothiol synthase [Georgenia sp. EYE_87]
MAHGDVTVIGSDHLERATVEQVLALADAVAAADGVAALSEQTLLDLRSPVRPVRHLLVDGATAQGGGALAGYAQVDAAGASAELAVHPDHRRSGLGRALLDAVRAHAPGVAVWAHGDLPGARALAAAAGLERVRELLQMALDLPEWRRTGGGAADGAPEIRTFRTGADEEAWVRLNARAFADHPEQGRMSVADLRAREAEDWFDPTLLWLVPAPDGVEVLASMWVKVVPGEDSGEIYALGVDPAAQGRGLGSALTVRALDEMSRRGLRRATLYVEGDNTAARRTYEREGFRCVVTDVQYR